MTPEEIFRAIGKLRKDARDEIERLLTFLDQTENHMQIDCEPEDESDGDCELEDGADDEPSLGSHEVREAGAVSYKFRGVCDGSDMIYDCEGDDHDGREPDEAGIGDLDGLLEQTGCGGWQGDRTGMG